MKKEDIRARLVELSDEKYKAFHEKLKPSDSYVIGVRMANIRKFAKELSKENWKEYIQLLEENDTYEEKVIAGMSIFYSKAEPDEKLDYTEKIVPFIDGWALCDAICATMKLKEKEKNVFWDYALRCALSKEEFRVRFGLVTILDCFVEDKYIDDILSLLEGLEYIGYYDSMAAAWLLADCMIKHEEKTWMFMNNNKLNDWVHNKAITKMRESYRVSSERKEELKKLMR